MNISQGSMCNIERLADEIQAESRAKFKRRRPMSYRGLRSNRRHQATMPSEFIQTTSGPVRALSEREVGRFKTAIQLLIDFGRITNKPIRLAVER